MNRRIFILRKQMLSNLNRRFIVKEMAESVNVSTSYLHKLFVAETGVSPIEYLRFLRIEKVKEMLEDDGFKHLKEICYEVGIKDQSHCVRDFKRKYGITPAKYREEFWAKIQNEESGDE